jgi:hypothetical protein
MFSGMIALNRCQRTGGSRLTRHGANPNQPQKLRGVDRLGDRALNGAAVKTFDENREVGIAGDQYSPHFRSYILRRTQQVQGFATPQRLGHNDGAHGLVAPEPGDRSIWVGSGQHIVCAIQNYPDLIEAADIIINDDNTVRFHAHFADTAPLLRFP